MEKAVEDFSYKMLVDVFNAQNTADAAVDIIMKIGSCDPGPNVDRIENPLDWTEDKIRYKASKIQSDKGPAGDYDD
jgi:fructose-bisphosphate aldolase, class II